MDWGGGVTHPAPFELTCMTLFNGSDVWGVTIELDLLKKKMLDLGQGADHSNTLATV